MNVSAIPPIVLLILGILMLIKSVIAVARPLTFRRIAVWWSGAALKVNTLCGIACILLAALIWATVLMREPLINWLLLLIGVFFAWGASLYFRPPALQLAIRVMILDRSPAVIRILFVFVAVLAAILIGVAISGF